MKSEISTAVGIIAAGIVSVIVMLCILGFSNTAADDNKLMGIMYHQVLKDESRHGRYVVSPDELESDLKYLSENGYTSLLPREVLEYAKNNTSLPDKTVVITFDDGYETGLDYVLPLLKKYNMKAVINIVGEYTDEYTELAENEKNLSFSYLTWKEAKQLSDSGYVEIGNHTYYMHGNDYLRHGCGKNDDETDSEYHAVLYSDANLLQQTVEEKIGVRPVTFAYPYGIISDGSLEVLQSAGLKVFLTCAELPSTITSDEPVIINRYNREHNRTVQQICSEYDRAVSEHI